MEKKPEYFFKYTTARAAKKTLKNLKVKYSSPLTFNDPFDSKFGLNIDYNPDTIKEDYKNRLDELSKSENEPEFYKDFDGVLAENIRLLRRLYVEKPRDEFYKILADLKYDKVKEAIEKEIHKAHDDWYKYMKRMVFFCVSESEEPDNQLMWSHYTNGHKGTVIKFKCLPGTFLYDAEKVLYKKKAPVYATNEDLVDFYTGQKKLEHRGKFLLRMIKTKSDIWEYEEEWRSMHEKYIEDDELFVMNSIQPDVIDSVYFGCNMGEHTQENLLRLLCGKLQNVKAFRVKDESSSFKLEFVRIK
ncbi:MAG: DUF2971 domain-containing protein [bacterium]